MFLRLKFLPVALLCSALLLTSAGKAEPPVAAGQDHTNQVELPNQSDAMMQSAMAQLKIHNDAAAEKILRRLIQINPGSSEAYQSLGIIQVRLGQWPDATESLKKCVQLNPNLTTAWLALARCYHRTGNLEEEVAAFKKYLEISPDASNEKQFKTYIGVLEKEIERTKIVRETHDADDYLDEATQNGRFRWSRRRMPIKVFIESGDGVPFFKESYSGILKRSFLDWGDAVQGVITFDFVDQPRNADIHCSWVGARKHLWSTLEGGHTKVDGREQKIEHANMVLLTTDLKCQDSISDEEMREVTLHEAGHSLGLLEHSSNPADVMFMSGARRPELSARDKKTMIALYGANRGRPEYKPVDNQDVQSTSAVSSDTSNSTDSKADDVRQSADNAGSAKSSDEKKLDAQVEVENLKNAARLCKRANAAAGIGSLDKSQELFRQAISLLEPCSDRTPLIQALRDYAESLKMSRKFDAAAIMEKRALKLEVEKQFN